MPSPADTGFYFNADSIESYLEAARQRVIAARTDLDGQQDAWIIEGNSPFVLRPDTDKRPVNAILMTHGLSDSPFSVRDIAQFFHRQGFYVLAIQLPGHGTRPGDLLHVRWHDWVRTYQHLLSLLQKQADNVYALGFSAGATLSIHQSLLSPVIKGLFLFAPALRVSPLVRLMRPLAAFGRRWRRLSWFEVLPDTDCFKYESLATNAIAEVYAMIQTVRHLSPLSSRSIPVFVAASEKDITLDSRATLRWFSEQKGPRKLLYYSAGHPQLPDCAKCQPASFPDQRIQSFSHTALLQSPDNPHYGANGTHRVCVHYYQNDPSRYERCKSGMEDCLGEIFDENDRCQTIRRLTYNPTFAEMLAEIREFMVEAGFTGLD